MDEYTLAATKDKFLRLRREFYGTSIAAGAAAVAAFTFWGATPIVDNNISAMEKAHASQVQIENRKMDGEIATDIVSSMFSVV